MVLYRDCFGTGAQFDNPASIGIFDASNNLLQNLSFALDSVVQLQSTINSSCVTAPNSVCTEAGYYTSTVTLPPFVGGYTIAYQRCCRNAGIQNIQNPDDVGATYVGTIPGSESQPANSSPSWNQLPPLYVCVDLPFEFNHSAFDADGDSLVYSLCTPYEGGTSTAPQPNPPGAPPYNEILWEPPYSLTDMLGGPVPLTIDPQTGELNAVPDAIGTYVIGMCVQEYRNGILLGETRRGFQLNVVNCQAPVASPDDINEIIPNSFTNCTEFVEFTASNSAGFDVIWDFGDPTTTSDVATGQNTSWTYPGPGTYDLTLIVFNPINPNDPLCTDTTIQTITVQDTVIPDAGPDTATCPGIPVQIGTAAVPGWTYQWTPTVGLDNPNIAQPMASISGAITYLLTATDAVGCTGQDSVVISLLANANADAGPDGTVCDGVGFQLDASGGVDYLWSPSTGLSQTDVANPIALPSSPTEYVVTVTDANGCSNTDTAFVDIFTIDAGPDVTICIGDEGQLNVVGGVSWTWSPPGPLNDPTLQSPIVNTSTITEFVVVGDDGTGCLAADTVLLNVAGLPNAFAGFDQGVCAGSPAQLNASGGVSYSWTPTTGLSNPSIANPAVSFSTDTATYVVEVTDLNGCVNSDTVTVWQEPLPNVVAGTDTTICVGESVQLSSSGGQTYQWSPIGGLSNADISNPVATPAVTTVYTVTVGQPSGSLVFNGDFSQGNVGFGSDYTYSNNLIPEARYSVVTDASTVHPSFVGTGHTGNAPLDSFLVVNGAGTPNQNVWCQTISVSPNTDYFFGAWVSTVVASSPAILQFSINGQVLGAPFTAPFNTNNWVQFFETWNSGTATSATICVVNQNTNTGGNDFAIDDITFSTFCTNSADVTISVNDLPQVDAGPDQSICVGQSTQMEGSGGVSYQWVPPVGLVDPLNPNTEASPNVTQTYTLIAEDNIGCSASDEMTLTVNPLPAATAGPDREICFGQSTVLIGGGGTDYAWSPATGLSDATSQLPTASPEQNTTYVLEVTDINSCVNTDTVNVVVNPLPIVDAGADSTICEGGSLVLQASGAVTYQWSPLVGINDPQSATPTATPIDPATFTVVGTDDNGCENTDSVNIDIFRIVAGPDSAICINDSVQVFVSGGVSYSWTPAEGVSDTASASPFLSPLVNTTYQVVATNEFGCQSADEVNIAMLTLPVSAFTAEFEPSCDGIVANFDNNSDDADGFVWSFGTGSTSNEFEPSYTFPSGAGSVVTLVTYNNDSLCFDSLTVDYSGQWFGNDTIEIKYGNVFTPNFDGINDCFRPGFDGRFSDCYQLKVFNRWGALIFESTAGQNHCWDGYTKGGKRCDEGTYYYVVSIKNYEKHGYVTLID